jgi:hypothetical protein
MHDILREVFEIQRAGEMGELMRESRIRHRKVKLQSGDEIRIGKGSAGCQPAVSGSLPETSADPFKTRPQSMWSAGSRPLQAGSLRSPAEESPLAAPLEEAQASRMSQPHSRNS